MNDERFNLAAYTLEGAARLPTKEAVVFLASDGRRLTLTYDELVSAVDAVRSLLEATGLAPSSRVMIRLRHSLEYAVTFLACAAGGFTAVQVSAQLTSDEVAFIAADAVVSLFVIDPGLPLVPTAGAKTVGVREIESAIRNAKARPSTHASIRFADTGPEDPAFIVYTSGTSGFPKGVLHAHRVVLGRVPMFDGWSDIKESDRVLHAGALNWTYTLGVGLLDPLRQGGTGVLSHLERDPADWPSVIESERITIFAAVPGLYRRILKYAALDSQPMRALRHCLTAGAALSPHLYHAWKEATSRELYEALGMSEISTYVSSGPQCAVKPGCPGKPQTGRRIAILPVDPDQGNNPLPTGTTGLLGVHRNDPGLMLGYLHNSVEDRSVFRGEWFTGGDLAHVDEEGYIHYHGRSDETMNSFGYRVSPLEVERVLCAHPRVAEAAVAEIPVADQGEVTIIRAFVVLKESISQPESVGADILAYAAEHLAHYKLPRDVRFVAELPRNANGKLLRKLLG